MKFVTLPSVRDTGSLACLELNQDFWLNPDYANRIGSERLVISLEAILARPGAVPGVTMPNMLQGILAKFPDMKVGSYLAGWTLDDVTDVTDGYYTSDPPRRLPGPGLPGCKFGNQDMLSKARVPIRPWTVDITQPNPARDLLADHLAEWRRRRDVYGLHVARSDNWCLAMQLPAVMQFFTLLNQGIQQLGLAHVANFSPMRAEYSLPDSAIQQIGQADVVIFEGALNPAMLKTPADVTEWLRKAQLVIAGGATPALVAQDWGAGYAAEHSFACYVALLLDRPYVGYQLWMARPPEIDLPAKLGTPTGAIVQAGMTCTRQFGSATLTVDFAARTGSIT